MTLVRHVLAGKLRELFSIEPDDPVLEAIQLMSDRHIGALPVVRGNELVGIVSERDYARKVMLMGRSSTETPIWQIMTTPVVTVGPEETIQRCMEIMTERRIRHLPVLEKGALVGIISIGDLVKAVIEDQQNTIEQLERYIAS
jgi:CBS domain-containing protein